MSAWVPSANGLRCERHAIEFGRLETCAGCESDPAPIDDDESFTSSAPVPLGCASVVDIEVMLLASARDAGAKAQEAWDTVDSWHKFGAWQKCKETEIKALRAAGSHAQAREVEYQTAQRERRMAAANKRARR